jgi:hypothetical protein
MFSIWDVNMTSFFLLSVMSGPESLWICDSGVCIVLYSVIEGKLYFFQIPNIHLMIYQKIRFTTGYIGLAALEIIWR